MGRVKKYKVDEVVAKAMLVFWNNGYQATSMQDLVDSMGINRFSLYQSFSNKRELFINVLEKYTTEILAKQSDILFESKQGLESIRIYYETVTRMYLSEMVPRGCLMGQAIHEFGLNDVTIHIMIKNYIDDLEEGFYRALVRAEAMGEITSVNFREMAHMLAGWNLGLLNLLRVQDKSDSLNFIHSCMEVLNNK